MLKSLIVERGIPIPPASPPPKRVSEHATNILQSDAINV